MIISPNIVTLSKKQRKNLVLSFVVSIFVVGGILVRERLGGFVNNSDVKGIESGYLVTRVIDGDTIEIEGDLKVRYIGIDTPETKDPNRDKQCFGEQASEQNADLVEGKRVQLEKDVSDVDRYGRLLRYVYVDGIFVNKYLVENGYARASSYPPDVKYQEVFKEAERLAREENRGLWSQCM